MSTNELMPPSWMQAIFESLRPSPELRAFWARQHAERERWERLLPWRAKARRWLGHRSRRLEYSTRGTLALKLAPWLEPEL